MNHPTDISSHAPLDDRLRGRAFIPGVHYASQAGAWMLEAADEIDRLNRVVEFMYDALGPAADDVMDLLDAELVEQDDR